MSEWINHVKKYQAEHGCSYKEALSCAKCSYKKGSSIEGGKLNLKKNVHRATKGVKKGSKLLKKNEKLIKFAVGDEYADTIDKAIKVSNRASKIADQVETQTGAGKVKHLGRKVKHSVGKARKVTKTVTKNIDKYAPVLEMVAPELAPVLAVNEEVKRINGSGLGSTRKGKQNPYLSGGSFAVPHAHGGSFSVPKAHGGCMTCKGGMVSSVLLSPNHPSFAPKNTVKSYAELITNN